MYVSAVHNSPVANEMKPSIPLVFHCVFQGRAVQFAGHVNRAFAGDRIPTGGVGHAAHLGLQSEFDGGVRDGLPNYTGHRLPGGAAGGAALDRDVLYFAVLEGYRELRGTEFLAIFAQHTVSGKGASRGGREAFDAFFTRCDQGDVLFPAQV